MNNTNPSPPTPQPTVVLTETNNRVCTIVLNRPDRGNALSIELMHALSESLRRASEADDVDLVVLRATGRHFCGGADLGWIRALTNTDTQLWTRGIDALFGLLRVLYRFDKPIVAVVQGTVVGGGVGLLCLADEVIAGHAAKWHLPEVKLGMVPTAVLPALRQKVSKASLTRLLNQDRTWTADEAVTLGIATESVPDSELDATAAARIDAWRKLPSRVMSETKLFQRKLDRDSFEEELHIAREHALASLHSEDSKARIGQLMEPQA